MKRAGEGLNPAYNANTLVDDSVELLPMEQAVKDNLGTYPH